jgi:hypothetical protein
MGVRQRENAQKALFESKVIDSNRNKDEESSAKILKPADAK